MKRFLIAVLAIAGTLPAMAADLKPAAKAPAYVPTTDPWTGFDIGVHAGYGLDLGTNVNAGNVATVSDLAGSPQGFVGGMHAGVGTRFSTYGYAGIEGDIDGAAINGTGSMPGVVTAKSENTFLGSIRARFGVIFNDDALVYGTAGYGFGGGQFSIADVVNGANTTVRPTMNGFVWGGGVEYAITAHLKARVEYLQYDFGTFSATMTPASVVAPVLFTQKDRVDVVRAGLTYHF